MHWIRKIAGLLKNPLVLAVSGNIVMWFARIWYSGDVFYGFLMWNLFLAAVPLFISNMLYKRNTGVGLRFFFLLGIWLLFLPNAPYIITDLVHLAHRPPVPFWYDMLLVFLTALNGLMLGFISLRQIEAILEKKHLMRLVGLFRMVVIVAMSYGVYVGRYLRFNSWDVFVDPLTLTKQMVYSVDKGTMVFVIAFSFVTYVLYTFFHSVFPYKSQKIF